MHHLKEKKFKNLVEQGVTADELREQMLSEQVPSEEIEKFIADSYPAGGDEQEQEEDKRETAPEPPAARRAEPAKSSRSFDSNNLIGEEFKAYEEYLGGLPLEKQADFHVFKVEPVITDRYPGLPGTPKDMTGIRKKLSDPIQKTRIPVKTALELNSQVRNSNRYYFIIQ